MTCILTVIIYHNDKLLVSAFNVWVFLAPVSIFAGERDPNKRKVKPVDQPIYDLDLESSDDSDFNPEEHKDGSDDSLDSNDEGSKQGMYLLPLF